VPRDTPDNIRPQLRAAQSFPELRALYLQTRARWQDACRYGVPDGPPGSSFAASRHRPKICNLHPTGLELIRRTFVSRAHELGLDARSIREQIAGIQAEIDAMRKAARSPAKSKALAEPTVGAPSAPATVSGPGVLASPLGKYADSAKATGADLNAIVDTVNNSVGRLFGLEQTIGAPLINPQTGQASPSPASGSNVGAAFDTSTVLLIVAAGVIAWWIWVKS